MGYFQGKITSYRHITGNTNEKIINFYDLVYLKDFNRKESNKE